MQRLVGWRLLSHLSAASPQLARAAASAVEAAAPAQQQVPCLAPFCSGGFRRFASSDASPPGGDGGAPADAAAPSAGTDAGEAVGGAAAGEAAAEGGEEDDEAIDLDDIELTDKGLMEALNFRGGVPERRRRRPTREEKGSYVDNADLDAELMDIAIPVPENVPLYDLNTAAPGLDMPRSDALDKLMEVSDEQLEAMLAELGAGPDDQNALHAGQRPILRWTVRMRLDTAGVPNPVNRKAACKVYLRELQEETGLTDAALRHIALVAGQRYNPRNGELTLTSERYPEREENRVHIMEMLDALIAEGNRVHPAPEGQVYRGAAWEAAAAEAAAAAAAEEGEGEEQGQQAAATAAA